MIVQYIDLIAEFFSREITDAVNDFNQKKRLFCK